MADNNEISVSITKDPVSGKVTLICSHERPGLEALLPYFDTSQKRAIRNTGYSELSTVIKRLEYLIPFQEWANLITKAIQVRERNNQGGYTNARVTASAGYLTIEGQVYSLSPFKSVPLSQTLQASQKLLLEDTKAQAESMISDAKIAASGIMQVALQEKNIIDALLAKTRREVSKHPPTWCTENNLPVKYNRYVECWEIYMPLALTLRGFDVKYNTPETYQPALKQWEVDEELEYRIKTFVKNTILWIPISSDGSYNVSSIYTDAYAQELPHISREGACMSLGDPPTHLKNIADYNQLLRAIKRCNSRVQLDSLKCHPIKWLEQFKDIMPVELYDAIKGAEYDWGGATALAKKTHVTEQVYNEQEDYKTTWST